MSNAAPVLHVLIPGLRGPLPPEAQDGAFWQQRLPALEKLFARARWKQTATRHFNNQLRDLFQLGDPELPAGALGWLGEGQDPGADYWLRADPVHLVADRDQLVLFDAASLVLSAEEAEGLIAACNQLLQEDGLTLHAATPQRWYLHADAPIRLQTTPVADVAGRYLQPYLPRGEDASRWLSLSTELQMLLHQAPQNSRREAIGKPVINSLWFWGAGSLPSRVAGGWQLVYADDPVVRGLALQGGADWQALPEQVGQLKLVGRCLIVDTRLLQALRGGGLEAWREHLYDLERHFFTPLLQHLQRRELAALVVESGGLRLTLERRDLARFWRRSQPLRHYLEF